MLCAKYAPKKREKRYVGFRVAWLNILFLYAGKEGVNAILAVGVVMCRAIRLLHMINPKTLNKMVTMYTP